MSPRFWPRPRLPPPPPAPGVPEMTRPPMIAGSGSLTGGLRSGAAPAPPPPSDSNSDRRRLIRGPRDELERRADGGVQRLHELLARRADQLGACRAELDARRLVAVRAVLVEVDPVLRVGPERHRRRMAVRGQRPGQLLVAEVLGHRDREHAPLPAGRKCVGWPKVGTAWLDAVVGTDRHVDRFLVAVEVADQETLVPSLSGPKPSNAG